MGRDKMWLDLDGTPLIEIVARRLLPIAGEIIFSSDNSPRLDALVGRLPVPAVAWRQTCTGMPARSPGCKLAFWLRATL